MKDEINTATSSGDFLIWIIMFSILIIAVGYLAYINKDIER